MSEYSDIWQATVPLICEKAFRDMEDEVYKDTGKTVYIAGPMTAFRDSHYNFPAFYVAQGLLEMIGYRVHNPARMDIDSGKAQYSPFEGHIVTSPEFALADAMRRDFKIIADCDAIVLMKGWQDSTGARKELRVAMEDFGLPAYELSIDDRGWPVLTPYVRPVSG